MNGNSVGTMDFTEMLHKVEFLKKKANVSTTNCWFDRKINGLSKDGKQRLRELEEEAQSHSSHADKKQIRYLQQLKDMKMIVPAFYRDIPTHKQLFNRIRGFCLENDIPEDVAARLIPNFIDYIHTGHMKAILLIGEAGCGKTTALKLLTEYVLQIPVEKIDVTLASRGHGLSGTNGSYQSATCGLLAQAMLRNNNLLNAFIFDEIDKCMGSSNHACLDEELLPLTDKSGGRIYDHYLENTMSSLQYCPIFFTGNNLEKINPILADRLEIIHFPSADVQRITSIIHKYADKRIRERGYHSYIHLDYCLLDQYIRDLVDKYHIRSLRKHEDMLDGALNKAFLEAMKLETDSVLPVSHDMFEAAEAEIISASTNKALQKKIGFA